MWVGVATRVGVECVDRSCVRSERVVVGETTWTRGGGAKRRASGGKQGSSARAVVVEV